MIHQKLLHWRLIPGFEEHAVWKTAFTWLETNSGVADEGVFPLGSEGFFARVMSYQLGSRPELRYEMHRHTIDIQYSVIGGEGIEIAPVEALSPLNDYSSEKDVEHFIAPPFGIARVDNRVGFFTVLFPGEPHMPKLEIGGISSVRKVVVKIPAAIVGLSNPICEPVQQGRS